MTIFITSCCVQADIPAVRHMSGAADVTELIMCIEAELMRTPSINIDQSCLQPYVYICAVRSPPGLNVSRKLKHVQRQLTTSTCPLGGVL